jgi:hypothetical protein
VGKKMLPPATSFSAPAPVPEPHRADRSAVLCEITAPLSVGAGHIPGEAPGRSPRRLWRVVGDAPDGYCGHCYKEGGLKRIRGAPGHKPFALHEACAAEFFSRHRIGPR